MKINTLSVLAGLTGSVILAGTANAAFTGVEWDTKTPTADNPNRLVLNMYATFDNPNDVLFAIAGTPNNVMDIQVVGGTFFQQAFGGDLAPNPALIAAFPSLADDSFVTIGKKTSNGDQTSTDPGWGGFGASSLGGSNLAWFITPDQPQGLPVDGRVLFAQFSTEDGQGFAGSFLLSAVSDGDASFQEYVTFNTVPAPGALALLGLAGVASRRRRRG